MLRPIQPILGDIVLKGTVALSFLFVLGLVIDAWWQKRQARLMRELARGQAPRPAPRTAPLRAFFRRFGGRLAIGVAIAAFVTAALVSDKWSVTARAGNQQHSGGLASYSTNFQGDATRPAPAGTQKQKSTETNLWDQTAPGNLSLDYKEHQAEGLATAAGTNTQTQSIASSSSRNRKR